MDTIFQMCDLRRNTSSSCCALPFEHISSNTPHTGPLTATYSGHRTPRNFAKSSTFGHLKLSVLSGVTHSHFSCLLFCVLQTQPQVPCATCGPSADDLCADNHYHYCTASDSDDEDWHRQSMAMTCKPSVSACLC